MLDMRWNQMHLWHFITTWVPRQVKKCPLWKTLFMCPSYQPLYTKLKIHVVFNKCTSFNGFYNSNKIWYIFV